MLITFTIVWLCVYIPLETYASAMGHGVLTFGYLIDVVGMGTHGDRCHRCASHAAGVHGTCRRVGLDERELLACHDGALLDRAAGRGAAVRFG
jgi:hypothetical protein